MKLIGDPADKRGDDGESPRPVLAGELESLALQGDQGLDIFEAGAEHGHRLCPTALRREQLPERSWIEWIATETVDGISGEDNKPATGQDLVGDKVCPSTGS